MRISKIYLKQVEMFKRYSRLTLVTVDSRKAELTGAGEVSTRLTDTAAMRTTHIRVNVSHASI